MRAWFKSVRTLEGLTQTKIAELSDMDITMINKIELGERRPSVENAKKIATVMNFSKYGFDWTKFYESKKKAG